MDNDGFELHRLEQLMSELFAPETNNERKRTIESNLHDFSVQINSWRPCLHFLSSTNNHYVSMFALSTLEITIGRRWPILPWDEKSLIRTTLYTLSLESSIVPFVRNKVIKLVVDIARHDWPHFYPDFYSNILQLLGLKHTRLIGLIYLRTVSEELGTPREDVSIHRKSQLLALLNSQVSITLDTMTELLVDTIKMQNRSGTITPPPSPTGGQSVIPARTVLDVDGLISGSREITIAALKVLAHLFSWITLSSEQISENLLNAIFTCAKYHDSMNVKQVEMAVQAVTTINELLYRPCLPAEADRLLLQIFEKSIGLFQNMERLDSIDESYMDKTTEYLQLFVTNHLKRLETCSKFPVNTLLEVLFYHTFQQTPTVSCYLRCLEIWTLLLEITQSQYATIALAVAERILQKISFKLDARILKELDSEILDENEETEWQHFLRCNIECLARVADISPIPVFTLLYHSWREGLTTFGEVSSALTSGQQIYLNDQEASNVCAHLRDLASTTQALARLYTSYIGDQMTNDCSLVDELVLQTVDVCVFARNNRLYQGAIHPCGILSDLVEVHSQFLASLQVWCHWIARKPYEEKQNLCQRCTDSCVWALLCVNSNEIRPPANLMHSAAHLFQSITAILKPNLWDQSSFTDLLCIQFPQLKSDTLNVLRRAIINGIVLPVGDADVRQRLMSTLVESLSQPLGKPGQAPPPESAIPTAVISLKQILDECSSSSTAIKKLLHSCLEPTVNRVLELLPYFVGHQSVCETLLSYLHSAFLVLQQQLGSVYMQTAVQGMLHIYSRENITSGPALDQLLEILILVVSTPSNAFKAFVPAVTSLCLGHVWPTVGDDLCARPDTTLALLRLFHSILLHKWQYFYKSSILSTFGNSDNNDIVEHRDELLAILETFGQALLQSDVNIFRQSLQSLEQVNSRWRLYQRTIFKNHLLQRFLMALFTVLFHRSHNLLADEITTAIHNLAIVNINWFFGDFLPMFLTHCEGLEDVQRASLLENFDKSVDQPTLTRSVLRLVSDLRSYQLCRPG